MNDPISCITCGMDFPLFRIFIEMKTKRIEEQFLNKNVNSTMVSLINDLNFADILDDCNIYNECCRIRHLTYISFYPDN